jgi:hypothetical protein
VRHGGKDEKKHRLAYFREGSSFQKTADRKRIRPTQALVDDGRRIGSLLSGEDVLLAVGPS